MGALVRLALPTVAGQIILVLYNMADTFFIGLHGSDAMLTAVTVSMPAFLFLSALANLFGVGGASVIAQAAGKGDRPSARAASSFAVIGGLLSALAYALITYLFLTPYLSLLGGDAPQVAGHARAYILCTVVFGGGASLMSILLSHLLRAEGRPVLAGIGISIGGLLNIALDPLFIFVLLPPEQAVLGAAIATALSNLGSLLFFLCALALRKDRERSSITFRITESSFANGIPRRILAAGLPAFTMTFFENVSFAVLDKLISYYGIAMQAGIGVAKKINMLSHCMVRGVAQGALPLIAYNYSARRYDRMRRAILLASFLSVGVALASTLLYLSFAPEFVSIFIHHASSSFASGSVFLRILTLGAPFSACAYTLISFFQAVGDGKSAFLIAVLRKGLLDIPLMLLFFHFSSVYGIVWATPIADAVCCATACCLVIRYLHSKEDTRYGRSQARVTAQNY